MSVIRNKEALIRNAKSSIDGRARKLALDGLEAAIEAVDPGKIIRSKVEKRNRVLKVGQKEFDLDKYRELYVVGGGKAAGKMAEALETILGDEISTGIVNIPHGDTSSRTKRIELLAARHPIPDIAGKNGAESILRIASRANEDDLIICLISGGGSSLMPLPRENLSLQDKQQTTNLLLKSGAAIDEINTVRKHISSFKGGWLAKKSYPATIVNLILSDVIGDPVDFIASGPTAPDSTTFADAIDVLTRHGIWGDVPQPVRMVLERGRRGLIEETPKKGDKIFDKVHNIVVGNNRSATFAAYAHFRKAGLNSLLLTSFLEGEAKHVGTTLASIVQEIHTSGNPLARPAAIVVGGETTVTVTGSGRGGRNQEIATSSALKISGRVGTVIASASTDGIDGPTDAAGALVDGNTLAVSRTKGLDAKSFLSNNDTYAYLSQLDDLIFTGPTGTNVNDLSVIVVA
jgi:glycerate-2-kinase